MIFDQQTLFSERQAITASAASTNVIDLGPTSGGLARDVGNGSPIPLAIQVVEAFAAAGAATLTASLQVDDSEAFGSPATIAMTPPLGKDVLVPGTLLALTKVAKGANKRYMRLYYTVATGPMTAGKIMAGGTAGIYSHG